MRMSKLSILVLTFVTAAGCGSSPLEEEEGADAGFRGGSIALPPHLNARDEEEEPVDPGEPAQLSFMDGDKLADVGEVFTNELVVTPPPVASARRSSRASTGEQHSFTTVDGITVSFESSDESIATVDDEGLVTAVGSGQVTITATATTATGAISSITYRALVSFVMTGWVGASDTELNFSVGAGGVELFRSTQADCDIGFILTCDDGQFDTLSANTLVVDTALTLDRPAFYTYLNSGNEYTLPMAVDSAPDIREPQVVEFLGRMWIIGGRHLDGTNSNTVWSSKDGINWIEEVASAAFPSRWLHTVTVFDNKIWVIAGSDGKNDVWSSEDGTSWIQATASAQFSPREMHAAFVFNNRLWVAGGFVRGGVDAPTNDLWSSEDGITWVETVPTASFPASSGLKILELGGTLYAIGNADNQIYSSSDGASWTQVTATPEFSARTNFAATAFGGRLWVMGGYGDDYLSDIWNSADGLTWTEVTGAAVPARTRASMLSYAGRLWVVGGLNNSQVHQDSWMSLDGLSWRKMAASGGFTSRWGHAMIRFANRLWIFPGFTDGGVQNDIWSSADGLDWSVEQSAAPFVGRTIYNLVEHAGKLWLMGGFSAEGGFHNDVWSSEDGVFWTEVSPVVPFTARFGSAATVFDGKMWIVGGFTGGGLSSDVWSSTDGATWTQELAAAPFSARSGHALTVFNGAMYLVGGSGSDVWTSSNGTDWSPVIQDIEASFSARSNHQLVVHDSRLWIVGGSAGGTQFNDVWSSADGASWLEETDAAAFSPREYLGAASFDDKLFVVGGLAGTANVDARVWSSQGGTTWRVAHRTVVTF